VSLHCGRAASMRPGPHRHRRALGRAASMRPGPHRHRRALGRRPSVRPGPRAFHSSSRTGLHAASPALRAGLLLRPNAPPRGTLTALSCTTASRRAGGATAHTPDAVPSPTRLRNTPSARFRTCVSGALR